jgi:ribosomal protein S18 acetylase RimI-like enzyme
MQQSSVPISIRPFSAEDAPAVRALAASLRRWFSPHDLAQIDALLHAQPTGWVAVAHDGELFGFVIGTPMADPRVYEIAWMAVGAPYQGQGIGTQLLARLVADLRTQGVMSIEVSTVAESSGYAPYESTRAFYHRRGFTDVRVDADYYWPGGDRLVLRRALP